MTEIEKLRAENQELKDTINYMRTGSQKAKCMNVKCNYFRCGADHNCSLLRTAKDILMCAAFKASEL